MDQVKSGKAQTKVRICTKCNVRFVRKYNLCKQCGKEYNQCEFVDSKTGSRCTNFYKSPKVKTESGKMEQRCVLHGGGPRCKICGVYVQTQSRVNCLKCTRATHMAASEKKKRQKKQEMKKRLMLAIGATVKEEKKPVD